MNHPPKGGPLTLEQCNQLRDRIVELERAIMSNMVCSACRPCKQCFDTLNEAIGINITPEKP